MHMRHSLAALALCVPLAHAEPIPVVASFSILGDLVRQVGGPDVDLTTLVGPDGDAHVYEPTPADVRTLGGATVVVVNGLGFEGWMERLLQATGYQGQVVVASAGVEPLDDDDSHDDHGHDHDDDQHDHGHSEHGHSHDSDDRHAHGHDDNHFHDGAHGGHGHHHDIDPHAWQSVANVRIYVHNIADGLAAADPDNAARYAARAAAYDGELQALDTWVRQQWARVPADQRRVVTSHDAFGYYGRAYGVEFIAPQGWSTEAEATAGDVAAIIRQLREERARALFAENVNDERMIRQIAADGGGVVGGTLFSDALSSSEPAASYIDMMRYNTRTLVETLLGD